LEVISKLRLSLLACFLRFQGLGMLLQNAMRTRLGALHGKSPVRGCLLLP
jgi:hypothetical protein